MESINDFNEDGLNMRRTVACSLTALFAVFSFLSVPRISAQDSAGTSHPTPTGKAAATLVVGHPFSATKYAWRIKLLPGGKVQFIRNERYPTKIARDADGRLMVQMIPTQDLLPECDHLDSLVPPVCPMTA